MQKTNVKMILGTAAVWAAVLTLLTVQANAQRPNLDLSENGTCSRIRFPQDTQDIQFLSDTLQGPSLRVTESGRSTTLELHKTGDRSFETIRNDVRYELSYAVAPDAVFLTVRVHNLSHIPFEPDNLSLVMGLSNYMESYPQWNNIYFPTLLRCEKTHFWGYLMNPDGHVLSISCAQPIASWTNYYNFGYGSKERFWWGHRIYTFSLDLLHRLPLPVRHPQDESILAPFEQKSWTIRLKRETALSDVYSSVSRYTQAPMFDMDRTSFEAGETAQWKVYAAHAPGLQVIAPDGSVQKLHPQDNDPSGFIYRYLPSKGPGIYKLIATDNHRISEASISLLRPYDWYMRKAMAGAIEYPQRMGLSCENWYGFYTLFEGLAHFPDTAIQRQTEQTWQQVIPQGYDTLKGIPVKNVSRIQNTSTTLSMYVDRYRLYYRQSDLRTSVQSDLRTAALNDLRTAAALADWLIQTAQSPDGAFRNRKVHYTSVCYIAKSLMELMAAERPLGETDPEWQKRYDRHYQAARKAIDQLCGGVKAIDTEGQLTFEDGMVSCSALQLALFGLICEDTTARRKYTRVAEELVREHRCLTQLLVPDSRMRGGTLRFWEAQYNLLISNNFISSPHGWSAWKAYATYYLYLLTGKEEYLVQTMNTVNTCIQVIDNRTGRLRWGFMVDPYVDVVQSSEDVAKPDFTGYVYNAHHPLEVPVRKWVAGEQYMDMVNNHISLTATDNDVHEIFKCLNELVIDKAYVFQKNDGTFITWNCKARLSDGKLFIQPASGIVRYVHVNTPRKARIEVDFQKDRFECTVGPGLHWIIQTHTNEKKHYFTPGDVNFGFPGILPVQKTKHRLHTGRRPGIR